MKKVIYLFLLLVFSSSVNAQFGNPTIGTVTDNSKNGFIPLYDKYEIKIDQITDGYGTLWNESRRTRTWHPDDVHLWAEFVSPSGKVYRIDGFFNVGYTYTAKDSANNITPCHWYYNIYDTCWKYADSLKKDNATQSWKIRFTPNEEGEWGYVIKEKDSTGIAVPKTGRFKCYNDGKHKGFARLKDKRYFKLDNGEDFYPLGHNYGWEYDPKQAFCVFLDHLAQAVKNKENYMRLFINSELGNPLVGFNSTRGIMSFNYMNALDSWVMDSAIEYCRVNNIYLQFCLFHGTELAKKTDWPMGGWKSNWMRDTATWNSGGLTYSRLNADGLITPNQAFDFSNPWVVRCQKDILRYIMARYGYASNVMSFELHNEFNMLYDTTYAKAPLPSKAVYAQWVDSMYHFIKSIDPHKRLVTNSVAGNGIQKRGGIDSFEISAAPVQQVYNVVDYLQSHTYNDNSLIGANPLSFTPFSQTTFYDADLYFKLAPNKPYIQGEGGFYKFADLDPNGFEVHNAMWSSLFTRASGATNYWNFGYLRNRNLFYHFNPMGTFLSRGELKLSDRFSFAQHLILNGSWLNLGYITNPQTGSNFDSAYGWVQNFNYRCDKLYNNNFNYFTFLNPAFKPANTSANFTLPYNGPTKPFQVEWFDAETGNLLATYKNLSVVVGGIVMQSPSTLLNGKFGDAIFRVTADQCPVSENPITIPTGVIRYVLQDTVFGGSITVMPGAQLIVKAKLSMKNGSVIELRRDAVNDGAKLIVDGGELNADRCKDKTWLGVKVMGNNNKTMNDYTHARCILMNGARIKGTLYGIRSFDGGIIQAERTTFYNCATAVMGFPYTDMTNPMGSATYFKNCDFIWDNPKPDTTIQDYFTMVELSGVHGWNFGGCNWINADPRILTTSKQRGTAIHAKNSWINLHRGGAAYYTDSCVTYGGNFNLIKGFYQGIVSDSSTVTDSIHNITVSHTDFINNLHAMQLQNNNVVKINECKFMYEEPAARFKEGLYKTGIVTDHCTRLKIYHNLFYGQANKIEFLNIGNSSLTSTSPPSLIYGNSFTDSSGTRDSVFANIYKGDNLMLDIFCNNYYGYSTAWLLASGSRLKSNQGNIVPPHPANNTFDGTCIGCYDIDDQAIRAIYYICSNAGASTVPNPKPLFTTGLISVTELFYGEPCDTLNCRGEYSGILNPSQLREEHKMTLWPNPADKTISIEVSNHEIETMSILNTTGQVVLQQSHKTKTNKASLSIQNIPAGVYIVRVQLENNEFAYKTLIIER